MEWSWSLLVQIPPLLQFMRLLILVGGQIYTYANYENYKRCLENEKVKAERERKQKILDERKEALSQYEDFFEKVGVKLNIHTTEKQYNNWLNKLKEEEERVELKRKKKILKKRLCQVITPLLKYSNIKQLGI